MRMGTPVREENHMITRIATASGMAVVTAIALAAVTACSSSSSSSSSAAVSASASATASSSSSSSSPLSAGGSSDSVIVGSANFPESELLAEVYVLALQDKGVKATAKLN